MLAASGWFIIGQVDSIKDREIKDAAYAVRQETYLSDLRSYDSTVTAHTLCVDAVARQDANRAQWQLLADAFAAFDTGDGKAIAFADTSIRSGPVLSAPRSSVNDCPVVDPLPEPPNRQ